MPYASDVETLQQTFPYALLCQKSSPTCNKFWPVTTKDSEADFGQPFFCDTYAENSVLKEVLKLPGSCLRRTQRLVR